MQNASLAELEQHALALEGRLLKIAEDIQALLADDLPRFAERELKKAFVSAPEFAASIGDETLRKLKKAMSERSQATTASIVQNLKDETVWTGCDVPEDPRASISANERLWSEVQRIGAMTRELAAEFGFPESEEAIEYRAPTWFIGRRYLPALSEKYWSLRRELAETVNQARSLRSEASRSELSDRWDKV